MQAANDEQDPGARARPRVTSPSKRCVRPAWHAHAHTHVRHKDTATVITDIDFHACINDTAPNPTPASDPGSYLVQCR